MTVCVLSYNYEKYIHLCLQSLVEQKTDFIFEVIVGDDCSTDGTKAIIEKFAVKYPEIVKPVYQTRNIGPIPNYMDIHRRALGVYVAHMDGDDYALPGKLQMQSDKLDSETGVNILWHRMLMFNESGTRKAYPDENAPFLDVNISRGDLMLYGPFGPHSATMYRRETFSLRYKDFPAIDWILSVDLMGTGTGIMMKEVLGAYRVHSQGMSGGAVANRATREWLCNCQLELIRRFPEYKSLTALRALLVAFLDLVRFQRFFLLSLKVFLKARAFPNIFALLKLVKFYQFSKLPPEFK